MSAWRREQFDAVLADESGGNAKTPKSEFLPTGRYAIVDQGKELVAGYTDDESRLCNAQLPVIVFGDHTRCFKYVDFPFCMGADGVKVLRPKIDADVKYLYHYLNQLRLTEGGYDRHFKYLKRSTIVVPPLSEQRRIAEILDKADALRAKRRAAFARLDTLTQSIFLDMFGDPLATSGHGRHVLFEVATRRITYGFTCPMKHLETGIPIVTAKNVHDGHIDLENVHYADQSEFDALTAKSKPSQGDVLITKDGTIGRCAVVLSDTPFCINQSVALIQPDHSTVIPTYMVAYLSSARVQRVLKNMGKGNALAHLQITELAKLPMPLPPKQEQLEFTRRISMVEKLKTMARGSAAKLSALFNSLQHRAFRGEL